MEDRTWVDDAVRYGNPESFACSARGVKCFEHSRLVGATESEGRCCPPPETLSEPLVELIESERSIRAIIRDGSSNARSSAVPSLHLRITRTNEEGVALRVMGRVEHRNGVRFRETCEEEEIRVLPEGVLYVIIANLFLACWDDRDGISEVLHEL